MLKSDIKVIKDGLEVNGKSIMGIMMLAAEPGSEIVVLIEGEDEQFDREHTDNTWEIDGIHKVEEVE